MTTLTGKFKCGNNNVTITLTSIANKKAQVNFHPARHGQLLCAHSKRSQPKPVLNMQWTDRLISANQSPNCTI